MSFFDSSSARLLKKLRKCADEGHLTRIDEIIEEEREVLLGDEKSLLLVTDFLLEVGFPEKAAGFAEKAMKRHRIHADEINKVLVQYYPEFTMSSKLLKTILMHYLYRHNFDAAFAIMQDGKGQAADTVVTESEEAVSRVWNSTGHLFPQANQISILVYAFCRYMRDEVSGSLEILRTVFRDIEFPHRSISALAYWIGSREVTLRPEDKIKLLGISIISGKFEQSREYLTELQSAEILAELTEEQIVKIISLVEERMFPLDDTVYSSLTLFSFYMMLEKLGDALRILKSRQGKFMHKEEFAGAVGIIAQHEKADSKALLFAVEFYLDKGSYNKARESLDLAFQKADETDTDELLLLVRRIIDEEMDSDFHFSRKLAEHLTAVGTLSDAIEALARILKSDPSWVFLQVERLINRDRRDASVLALLAATLMENAYFEKAGATLRLLLARDDRLSIAKSLAVFEHLEEQISAFPKLREARAMLRLKAGKERKAASDWYVLMLAGEEVCDEGQDLLKHTDVNPGTVESLIEAGFMPAEHFSSLIAGMIYIREGEVEAAVECFRSATERADYHILIAEVILNLPDDVFSKMQLESILPLITGGDTSRMIGGILLRDEGTENWKLELVNSLRWENRSEGAYFRLRYLLENGKLFLAGSSFDEKENDNPVLSAIAESCRQITAGQNRKALTLLNDTVHDPEYSRLSAFVLRSMISLAPSIETEVRLLLAQTAVSVLDLDEAGRILEPICSEEGVLEFVEGIYKMHNGSVPLLNVLIKASIQLEDFLRFRTYSSVLLDIDPGVTERLSETALQIAEKSDSADAWLHAARLARISDRNADIDAYIISALQQDPEIGHSGTIADLGTLGNSATVLHAASICDAGLFKRTLADCSSESIPLNGRIINGCLEVWNAERDGEALSLLAEIALSAGLTGYAEEILAVLSLSGGAPWNIAASKRLLQEVSNGRMESLTFWRSVSDSGLVEQGLSKLLPDGFDDLSDAERKEVADSVLTSKVRLDTLIELSKDKSLFETEDKCILRKLAELCYSEIDGKSLKASDAKDVVKILAEGGMTAEAVEVARSFGDDDSYSEVRKYLCRDITSAELEGIEKADAMLRLNNPEATLSILTGLDMDSETWEFDDLRAQALWMLNLRKQSVLARISSYRRTGNKQMLLRILWAMRAMGCSMETRALRRYLAAEHPEMANMIGIDDDTAGNATPELISALHLQLPVAESEQTESEGEI